VTLNQILDIAIILVGVYATLSCICSWINEKIASWLRLRGWNLFKGIMALVDTHAMAAAIFNHPLVDSASSKSKSVDRAGQTGAPSVPLVPAASRIDRFRQIFQMKPPSYLDARNFSSALWSVVATNHPADLQGMVAAFAPAPVAGGPAPAAPTGATALAQAVIHAPNDVIKTLERTVQNVPSDDLRGQLQALLAAAGNDYEKLLAATDGWFNAQMDRVSGWYKRETQWILIAIGLFVVTVTGVDSIEIVRILSATDAATLEKIADTVRDKVPDPQATASPTSQNDVARGVIKVSLGGTRASGPQNSAAFDVTTYVHPISDKNSLGNWGYHHDVDGKPVYWRAPGMIVTYLALVLGGPFWFDALKALANIRSSGRKPSRKDQPPK
jgi:hypothetical protein